jgi:SAM-dependent methyltransferase
MQSGAAWAGDPAVALSADTQRTFAYFDRHYARFLPSSKEATVLDFGCGFGPFLAYLDRAGYHHAVGVDVDERCVEFCREHVSPNVRYVPNTRAYLEGNAAQFDLIVAREVAYYFPAAESGAYFCALRRALKPSGKLLVEVFNGALVTGLYPRLNDPWIATAFSEHSLRRALQESGFRVTDLIGASGVGFGPRYALWRGMRRLWSVVLRAIYALERGLDPLNPQIFEKHLIAVAELA